MHLVRTDMLW